MMTREEFEQAVDSPINMGNNDPCNCYECRTARNLLTHDTEQRQKIAELTAEVVHLKLQLTGIQPGTKDMEL